MKISPYLIVCALISALGGLLFGFETAVISGTTKTLKTLFDLSDFWLGFTVSIALIGTVVGAFTVGPITDRWGRRRVLMGLAVLYLAASFGCALAINWGMFLVFRFMGGLAVGGASVVCPLYIAEIAPASSRGKLVALNQWNVVFGILVAFVSNLVIDTYIFGGNTAEAWRWMFGVMAIPSAVFFVALFFIPESPRWLMRFRREAEALQVLKRFKYTGIPELIQSIRESLHEEATSEQEKFFQKKYKKPILLAFMVASFNQLAGINILMYYTKDVFEMSGAASDAALWSAVGVGATNLIFTTLALFFIDRFGRKILLQIGAIGTAITLALVGYGFVSSQGMLVLVSLLVYIAFFAFSSGAVIWVYISEIFPNRVRGRGQAFGSFTHWAWNAVISWIYPLVASMLIAGLIGVEVLSPSQAEAKQKQMQAIVAATSGQEAAKAVPVPKYSRELTPREQQIEKYCQGSPFFFFSLMMILQLILVTKYMPETKGISLEQIQKKLGIQ